MIGICLIGGTKKAKLPYGGCSEIDRFSVEEIICAQCLTKQKVSNCCENCGITFGKYCRLPIYLKSYQITQALRGRWFLKCWFLFLLVISNNDWFFSFPGVQSVVSVNFGIIEELRRNCSIVMDAGFVAWGGARTTSTVLHVAAATQST